MLVCCFTLLFPDFFPSLVLIFQTLNYELASASSSTLLQSDGDAAHNSRHDRKMERRHVMNGKGMKGGVTIRVGG